MPCASVCIAWMSAMHEFGECTQARLAHRSTSNACVCHHMWRTMLAVSISSWLQLQTWQGKGRGPGYAHSFHAWPAKIHHITAPGSLNKADARPVWDIVCRRMTAAHRCQSTMAAPASTAGSRSRQRKVRPKSVRAALHQGRASCRQFSARGFCREAGALHAAQGHALVYGPVGLHPLADALHQQVCTCSVLALRGMHATN